MQGVYACAVHTEHPLDLVVHPLPEPDFHGQAVRGQGFHLCRGEGGAIRQRHALGKAPAHLLGQRCVNDHRIGLGDMALRGKDLVGEAAVIRQQNKASAGLVQPAGREQLPPGVGIPDQIHHGGIPLVGGSAHHALRLVEHQVDELLVSKRRTVHRHAVPFPELGVPLFAHRAVHRHPSPAQQGLCLAPGALRRLGQIFV